VGWGGDEISARLPHMKTEERKRRHRWDDDQHRAEPPVQYAAGVLDRAVRVYGSKKTAVEVCASIAAASQAHKAHVLAHWMLDTADGALLVGNAVLRACADMARPYIEAGIMDAFSNRAHPRPAPPGSRVEAAREQDERATRAVAAWERELCAALGVPAEGPRADWTTQSVTELMGDALYTLAFERACLDLRTTWRWTTVMMILCPWGRDRPFHILPVHDIDLRAKEALAGLVAGRAFTTSGLYVLSSTHYASTFRYNSVLNQTLSPQHEDGRARGLLAAAFLLLVAAHFRQFCMVPRGTPARPRASMYSAEERAQMHRRRHVIAATLDQIRAHAVARARAAHPLDCDALTRVLEASARYVQRHHGRIVCAGLPPALFRVSPVKVEDEDPGDEITRDVDTLTMVRQTLTAFAELKAWTE